MTVVLAGVLFLGAISTQSTAIRLQAGVLGVAATALLASAAVIASFPTRV